MVFPRIYRVVSHLSVIFPSSTKPTDRSGRAVSPRRENKRLSEWVSPMVCRAMLVALWTAMAVVLPVAAAAQTAHFAWAQVTLSTNFGQVLNVAVDASGNVFAVDDYNSQVYEIVAVNGVIPPSPTFRTLASGSFPYPTGVAVDTSGNVYVSDETKGAGNNGGIWELLAVSGRVPDPPTIVQLGSGFKNPEDVAVDSSGDVFVADTGNNSIKEMVAVNGSIPASPTINTLGSGFGFFEPTSGRVDASGNVFVADVVLTGGAQGGVFEILAAGGYNTVKTLSTDFIFPHNAAVDGSGNVFVADVNAGPQSNGEIFELLAVGGSIPASPTMVTLGGGWATPAGMTVDRNGNLYVADSNAPAAVELVRSAVNFGSVNVGSTSGTKTLIFVLDSGGSGVSPAVLTQGTVGLDFTDAGTGTCTTNGTSFAYHAGDTCTVDVIFAPKYPGQRLGAVELTAGGNALTKVPVYGMGVGPQIAYSPGTQSNVTTGLNAPEGLAVDSSGNIYVAAPNNNSPSSLYEYSPNGSGGWTKTATISSTLNNPTSLAVDGAGNVFACNYGGGVDEYSLVSGVWTKTAAVTSESGDYGLAVDGNENAYVANLSSNDVREYSLVNGTWTQTVTVASGLGGPFGIAVDGSGDVFVVDNGNTALLEYSLVNGVWKKTATIATGLNYPLNVAVDAAGNVYVTTGSSVSEYSLVASTWTNIATIGTGLTIPEGVTLDDSGNIYMTDWSTGNLVQVNRSVASSLSFATTNVGSTSTDSPKTVAVENVGNAALNFTALNYPTDFPEEAGGTDPCTSTTSLNPTSLCNLNIDFAPKNAGSPLSEDVILTDNSLNVSGAQQSIQVSGTAAAPPTLTKAFGAISISQGATTTLTFTVANPNTKALTGIAFTDTLPTGLTVATPNGLTGFCSSGTITAAAGSGIVSLTGASLAGSATCTLTVNVTATGAGTKVNVTGPVSSNEGGTGNVATATLSVVSITMSPSGGLLSGGTVGTAYSQQFTAANGATPYAYKVTAGALPAGLTLGSSSGLLAGTPAAGGSFSFTVRAKDSNSATVSHAYTLNIASPVIAVSSATLHSGTVGASYSQTITASGGTAPYSYRVTAGALPTGLSLSAGGILGGTPAASGSFSFTVTATDSSTGTGPYAGSGDFALTISKATATVTLGNLTQAYTGAPVAATTTTTPAGLAVSLTYNGSATAPTAVGRYTVVATVNDPNYTGTAIGTLVINQASQTISFSSSTLAYAAGVTYGVTPLQLGATSSSGLSVTFSLVSGPATLSGNMLTITGAGSVIIAANQPGNTDYSAAPQVTETIIVNQALPVVALVSSVNPVLVQNGTTLTATITSGAGTPTGAVTFVDGATPIGIGTLASGVATLNISSLAVGTHSIAAAYGGDQNFMAVTSSPSTELVEDFSFNISAPAVTVLPGGTAVFTFTVTPIGAANFPANITLSASGLSEGATYTFSPATLAAGEGATTVTLTINLPPTQAGVANMHPDIRLARVDHTTPSSNMAGRLAPLSFALILLPFAGRLRSTGRRLGRRLSTVLLLAVGTAAVAGISGCGSGNGFFAQQQQTFSVTVTGTAGALSHSATVSLTVE